MANVFICPSCGKSFLSEKKEKKCPECDWIMVDSGFDSDQWETMSEESKEAAKKAVKDGKVRSTKAYGQPSSGESDAFEKYLQSSKLSNSDKLRKSNRLFWLGILRGWAKFMIVAGIIGAIGIGIAIAEYCWLILEWDSAFASFLVGLLAAVLSGGTSVLIPAALMALANMAEDIGDMRDKKMSE